MSRTRRFLKHPSKLSQGRVTNTVLAHASASAQFTRLPRFSNNVHSKIRTTLKNNPKSFSLQSPASIHKVPSSKKKCVAHQLAHHTCNSRSPLSESVHRRPKRLKLDDKLHKVDLDGVRKVLLTTLLAFIMISEMTAHATFAATCLAHESDYESGLYCHCFENCHKNSSSWDTMSR